jgi:hypothetical protein
LIFGLIAIYLRHVGKVGKFGLIALMVALFGQVAWAGGLLIDGTFNPLLAMYDPEVQTNIHAASHHAGVASASSGDLSGLLGVFTALFAVNFLTYVAGYVLMGVMIIKARIIPRFIGVLFIMGAPLVATSLFTPPWVETVGYVALGAAFVWAGLLLWKSAPERAE